MYVRLTDDEAVWELLNYAMNGAGGDNTPEQQFFAYNCAKVCKLAYHKLYYDNPMNNEYTRMKVVSEFVSICLLDRAKALQEKKGAKYE